MSMYLCYRADDRWEVRSSSQENACYVGSLDECRDWLDHQEGLQQQSLWSYLKSLFAGPATISTPILRPQKQESWS
ncbi:MAG: hypothetical protein HUJ26_21045 [Planctomycetaceae bacterium]|nr:hypothetical protein [Planctomycetaceae bacterium]